MNREQRRAKAHPTPLRGPQGKPQRNDMSIDYGHNGQVVVVQFSQHCNNLALSDAQVDGMIEGLKLAKSKLNKHKATAARLQGHGNA